MRIQRHFAGENSHRLSSNGRRNLDGGKVRLDRRRRGPRCQVNPERSPTGNILFWNALEHRNIHGQRATLLHSLIHRPTSMATQANRRQIATHTRIVCRLQHPLLATLCRKDDDSHLRACIRALQHLTVLGINLFDHLQIHGIWDGHPLQLWTILPPIQISISRLFPGWRQQCLSLYLEYIWRHRYGL